MTAETVEETIVLEGRYCGPDGIANGGYVCGMLAGAFDGAAEVTLKSPPPLDAPLTLVRDTDGARLVGKGGEIAVARPATLDLDVPAAPSWKQAADAEAGQIPADMHLAPHCFVCGPKRAEGDAMRILAGPVEGRDIVAGTWTVDDGLAGPDGLARREFLFCALDCPGYISVGRPTLPALLGRMTGEIVARPKAGERCIAVGWPIAEDGRKFTVGTAVHAEDGRLLAKAKSVWIALKG